MGSVLGTVLEVGSKGIKNRQLFGSPHFTPNWLGLLFGKMRCSPGCPFSGFLKVAAFLRVTPTWTFNLMLATLADRRSGFRAKPSPDAAVIQASMPFQARGVYAGEWEGWVPIRTDRL